MRCTYLTIFMLLVTASCSTFSQRDYSLEPHIKEFEEYFDHKVETKISFSSIPGRVVGLCFWKSGPKWLRRIVIDSEYWAKAEDWDRESLLFHELGHCEFGLDHDNRKQVGMFYIYPKSLMNKSMFHQYISNRAYYLKDLKEKIDAVRNVPRRTMERQ